MRRAIAIGPLLAVAALVAGCGGGGGESSTAATTAVPLTHEIEGSAARVRDALCGHDAADLLREGRVSKQQADQLEDLQTRMKC
jgi:hypothetical protein